MEIKPIGPAYDSLRSDQIMAAKKADEASEVETQAPQKLKAEGTLASIAVDGLGNVRIIRIQTVMGLLALFVPEGVDANDAVNNIGNTTRVEYFISDDPTLPLPNVLTKVKFK